MATTITCSVTSSSEGAAVSAGPDALHSVSAPASGSVAASASVSQTVVSVPTKENQPPPVVENQADHEQFSGFRISKRCFTREQVAAQFRGAKVLRMPRVSELRNRAECNRIVIGVLYNFFVSKLGNGELYMKWCLTDLAEPEPNRLTVQLRGRAYDYWRKNSASLSRSSIFAIMNPRDPMVANNEWTVRVENHNQLAKLGECPSLGLCDMKGCQLPCNLDLKDRFCKMHLGLAYANKGGRMLTGGINASAANLLSDKRMKKRVKSQVEEEEEEDKEDAEKIERAETAKRLRTTVAMQLDERRFMTSEANDNYLRAIREGSRADKHETSRVPVLGRAFKEDSSLEIDLATIETSEKSKANRVIAKIVEDRAERHVADMDLEPEPSLSVGRDPGRASKQPSAKASSSSGNPPKAPKKSLNDLMEALKGRHLARRTGVAAASRTKDQQVRTDQPPGPAPAATQPKFSINELFERLMKAGDDMSGIKEVLDEADKLPISVLEGPEGGRFYSLVGSLTMHSSRADIRRAALLARRRWRSASFDARQSQERDANTMPSSEACPADEAHAERGSEDPASSDITAEKAPPEASSDAPTGQESHNEAPTGNLACDENAAENGAPQPSSDARGVDDSKGELNLENASSSNLDVADGLSSQPQASAEVTDGP